MEDRIDIYNNEWAALAVVSLNLKVGETWLFKPCCHNLVYILSYIDSCNRESLYPMHWNIIRVSNISNKVTHIFEVKEARRIVALSEL